MKKSIKKSIKKLVSLLCMTCILAGGVTVAHATDDTAVTNEPIIIKSVTDEGAINENFVQIKGIHKTNNCGWLNIKPTDERYLAGIEGIFKDTDAIPSATSKAKADWRAIFDLSSYSGKYEVYYLNLNTGVDSSMAAHIDVVDKNGNTNTALTYKPSEKGNGEWLNCGTHELGTGSSLTIYRDTDGAANLRISAVKLVPVKEEFIIKGSASTLVGGWKQTSGTIWSEIVPTEGDYVAGIKGIFSGEDKIPSTTQSAGPSNTYAIYDLSAYSGKYEVYFLNLNKATDAANTGAGAVDVEAHIEIVDKNGTSTSLDSYKPIEKGNGEWMSCGTYLLGGQSSLKLCIDTKKTANLRNAAVKLVFVESDTLGDSDNNGDSGSTNEIIISCSDSRLKYTGSWKDGTTTDKALSPTGEAKRISTLRANVVYDLSEFNGIYDLYFFNLNSATVKPAKAQIDVGIAGGEVLHGVYEFTTEAKGEWMAVGTYELDANSFLALTNLTASSNLRNVAIKLVLNDSGEKITPGIEMAAEEIIWRTIEPDTYIVLDPLDNGATKTYGWKQSYNPYPAGKVGFYTFVQGEWCIWKPHLTKAEDITIWYLYEIEANDDQDPNLQVEVYAEGELHTFNLDFTSGKTGWEELGTYDFDGSGEEYIKVTKVTSGTGSQLTNIRLGYKSAIPEDEQKEEFNSVYNGTEKEILQRIGLLTGTADGITEEYVQTAVTKTDLEVLSLKLDGRFEEAAAYVGSTEQISASDYAKMLLEHMGYVSGTDFTMENIIAFAADIGIEYDTEETFTIDVLADMTVQALNSNMKGEKRSFLGSVMDKIEPIAEDKYTNPTVFTDEMRAERETAKDRDRSLIYNNDGNDAYVAYETEPADFDYSTLDPATLTHEKFLSKRTTPLLNTQVDSIFYCTGVYSKYHHKSEIADLHRYDWAPALFEVGETLPDGTVDKRDSLQTVLDCCKENGIECMWSMRMNDTHDSDYENMEWLSDFKQEHPDWMVSSRETSILDLQMGALWSAMDYGVLGVRQRSYDLLREVLMNYDVDGIELDFSRHSVYFAQVVCNAEDANPENLERMNNFMRSLRTLTEQISAEKGKPILIAISVADSMDYCKAIGLDVKQWMEEELVDIVSLRTYGAYQSLEDGLAEYNGYDVPIYSRIDVNNKTTGCNYQKEAYLIHDAGYDGVYLFNHFTMTSNIFKQLGSKDTCTYDPTYTEHIRIPTDKQYAYRALERFVVFGKETQSISFAENSVAKTYGDEDFTITAAGDIQADSSITYTSSNTKVAMVNETTGQVTLRGAGEAVITAKASGTKTHAYATATYTLTVAENEEEPTPTPGPEITPTPGPEENPLEILVVGTAESYHLESNAVTAIHCSGKLEELESVKMDGTVIDKANYDLTEGSTIVTFKTAYLDSLSEGEHTVTLCYSDNRSIDSKLTIKAADTPKVEEDDDDDSDYVEDTAGDNAAADDNAADTASGSVSISATPTGDNSNIGLWLMILAIAAAGSTLLVYVRRK